MIRDEILNSIKDLSYSQGFYARIYEKLIDGSLESNEFLGLLERQNFNDVLDLILYLEC